MTFVDLLALRMKVREALATPKSPSDDRHHSDKAHSSNNGATSKSRSLASRSFPSNCRYQHDRHRRQHIPSKRNPVKESTNTSSRDSNNSSVLRQRKSASDISSQDLDMFLRTDPDNFWMERKTVHKLVSRNTKQNKKNSLTVQNIIALYSCSKAKEILLSQKLGEPDRFNFIPSNDRLAICQAPSARLLGLNLPPLKKDIKNSSSSQQMDSQLSTDSLSSSQQSDPQTFSGEESLEEEILDYSAFVSQCSVSTDSIVKYISSSDSATISLGDESSVANLDLEDLSSCNLAHKNSPTKKLAFAPVVKVYKFKEEEQVQVFYYQLTQKVDPHRRWNEPVKA